MEEPSKKLQPDTEPQLMITVSEEMEANRIAAALEDEGIPVAREYSRDMQASNVLMGNTIGEIRLLVPSSEQDRAKDILIGIGALENDAEEPPKQPDEPAKKHVSSFWLMVLVLLLAVLAVFGTDTIVGLLRNAFAG